MKRIATIEVPQANTLAVVGELLALIDVGIDDKATLAKRLGIDPRQVDYYKHAARILGFGSLSGSRLVLADRGHAYLKAKRPAEKFGLLTEAVRETEIFRRLLERHTEAELNKANVIEFLRGQTHLGGSTPPRRAATILAWLKAILKFDPENFNSTAQRAAARAPEEFRAYRHREEGPLHSKLKTTIAQQPTLLGEPLTLVQMEYQFPTNDRADLLFLDARAKFLAVEIEVDVGALDIAGLLQAAKYQSMIRVQFGRDLSGVRGMLAARFIHPTMKDRALRHGIEIREVKSVI